MSCHRFKQPNYTPGGRLERTLLEMERRKAALRWRRQALRLGLLVFIVILLGVGLVILRMEQSTLWLYQKYSIRIPKALSFDLFDHFPLIR
jgi:hypothetical protein